MENIKDKSWDLTILFDGFDDERFLAKMSEVNSLAEKIINLAKSIEEIPSENAVKEYILLSEKFNDAVSEVMLYSSLRNSTDTSDSEALSYMGKIMTSLSTVAAPLAKIAKIIGSYGNLIEIIDNNEELHNYRYLLENLKRDNKYLLGDGEEAVFAKMNISGAGAWSDLHSALTSSVKANFRGEEIPLSSVRNLAYSANREVRREAYEAELACYDKIKDSVAYALNSIKLQVINECKMRGYESPLAKTLHTSRMKRETLDALIGAMEEYMPHFRKYLKR